MPTPIDNLQITITSTGAGQVRKNLEEVASGLRTLREATKGSTAGLGNTVGYLQNLITAINRIPGGASDKLHKVAEAVSKIKEAGKGGSDVGLSKIAMGLLDVSEAAGNIQNIENLERLADVLERLKNAGFVKLSLSGVSQVSQQAASMVNNTVGGGSGTNGGGDIGSVADDIEDANEGMEDLTMSAKEADKVLASLKSKYFGWMKAIGRIALYRAIRSILKGIMQSLNDGLDHFYQYSVKINGLYATARAEIKTSLHYVSDALGAAAGQLIEKIYPVVVKILDATAHIFNCISEMVAFLSGEDTYTKAVRGIADINGEAKKLKATILGFDEINKLNGNNGSGDDELGHFVEAQVDKARAGLTTGIVTSLTAILAGSAITSVAEDVLKLADALGTSGLAKAAQEAGESFGTWGTGENGTGGSGVLGAISTLAAGVTTVLGVAMVDFTFESLLDADTVSEKIAKGFSMAIQEAVTLASAAKIGGIWGVLLTLGVQLTLAIEDVLVNDKTRGKIKEKLNEAADVYQYGAYFDKNDLIYDGKWDMAYGLRGVAIANEEAAYRLKHAEGFLDKADAYLDWAADAFKASNYIFGGGIQVAAGNVWDWISGGSGGGNVNVTVEIDGQAIASAVKNGTPAVRRRGVQE